MGIKALDGANRRIVSYVVIVGLALAFAATADVGTRLAYSEVALTARVEAAVAEFAEGQHPSRRSSDLALTVWQLARARSSYALPHRIRTQRQR